jgi:hypothetical protein
VRDDQIGRFDKSPYPGNVDYLAGHHVVVDAGHPRDVGGDGDIRLLQSAIDISDIADVSGFMGPEQEQSEIVR